MLKAIKIPHTLTFSSVFLFLFFILWALILTYPLPLRFFSHIPRGSEEAATVPFFNLWTLQWNIDQQIQGYSHYWDAPIFAPAKGTFAFSEPQPLSALLAAPLWLAFRSPALGYNFLVILFLTLNGWFAFWLLRYWRVSFLPSLLAGLIMQTLPFVAQEMGVLQLIAVFGFLWTLLFLSRFLTLSSPHRPLRVASSPHLWQTGLCLALGTPITFLTCGYYGLFSLLFLPLAFVLQLRREHANLKSLGQLVAVAVLALALTGPFLWEQQQRLAEYHFTRSAQTIESNSAKLEYYRNFLDYHLLYGQILALKSGQGQRLFPGLGLLMLAGLGLFGRPAGRVKLYLLLAVALALLLSLGLRLNLGGVQPYQWVRDFVPGFAQLRSPFRFAVLVQLHLSLLAGFGLDNLLRWIPPPQKGLLVVFTALALFDLLAWPLPLQDVPTQAEPLPWQVWLNQQPTTPLNIVMLPFAPGSKVEDFEPTTRWMLANRYFQGAMLNGYSGFFPSDHGQLRDDLLKLPTDAGLERLRQKHIKYIVVYHNLPAASSMEQMTAYLPLVYHDTVNNVAVYAIPGD
ncbi:MAG: hypothetical protein HC875_34345 [Anaerolineales bacterium]|nr:hypothetical protein [Anaerolineales bacterium]